MKRFEAGLLWERGAQAFTDLRYSRAHAWRFDGGLRVPASWSPQSVPEPMSDPAALDPEEALVAAAGSCHMLFFLSLAAARGYIVDRYEDDAVGTLAPDAAGLADLHREAHARCYVANSLRGEVVVGGVA